MTATAKNADSVTPEQRMNLERSENDRRPPWAAVGFVLALVCLAYQNVQHRDYVVGLKETHAAEIRRKDREIEVRKGEPAKQACHDYAVHMEGFGITWCRKPGIWL